jgi:hypothetical protein
MSPLPPPTTDWPAALSPKTAASPPGIDRELLSSIIEEQFDPVKHHVRYSIFYHILIN